MILAISIYNWYHCSEGYISNLLSGMRLPMQAHRRITEKPQEKYCLNRKLSSGIAHPFYHLTGGQE